MARPPIRCGWPWRVCLLSCSCIWLAATVISAQVVRPGRPGREREVPRVLMLAPREYQQRLKQAERAIAQRQYGEAIDHLGSLLHTRSTSDQPSPTPSAGLQEDYFLGRPGQSHYRSSLRSQALRLLGSLPAEGKELYELQFGAEARRRLQGVVRAADVDGLADVSRQYFHTQAGYRATFLLGRLDLDRGRPLAAAMGFQRLADTEAVRRKYDPELSLLLATSWRMSGMPDKTETVLTTLRQRLPSAEFVVRGESVKIFQRDAEALEWLDRVLDPPTTFMTRVADEWLLHRGDAARNAQSDGGLPLLRPRWRVPVANDPDDEEHVRKLALEHREAPRAALPRAHPLLIDGVVLMRTTDNMLAVDFETGKRLWEFPWSAPLSAAGEGDLLTGRNPELRRQQLEERLWRDAIHGQLSSDGRSVFLIDQLGYTLRAAYGAQIRIFRGMPMENPDQPKDYNSLVALDVATQGKYRWRVGGMSGEDEPALANAFFLGPPLVLAENLYVLAEVRGDISLFVLDAQTGRLQWSQQLAHVGQFNILADAQRRLAAAGPSYLDGVLVCPTSGGAVVAVDIANRSLLWGVEYPRTASGPTSGVITINSMRRGTSSKDPDGWVDSTVTLSDGRAIVTPVEAGELFCLDLLTGELLWKQQRPNSSLYVACVHEGRIILVGRNEVTAMQLTDGQIVWTLPLTVDRQTPGQEAMSTGRGFLAEGRYYVPTTTHLLQVDLQDGQLLHAAPTKDPLGNLVCYRDQVISLGPHFLTTYYRAERLQELVRARLEQHPKDPWALEQQALLWLEQGQREEALRALREALREYAPQDDRREAAQDLLVDTLLDALEKDFAANGQLAAEVNELIDRPLQREKYLRLMAQGLLRAGQAREAFEAFLELALHELPAEISFAGELAGLPLLETGDHAREVRRDRFVRAGIQQSLQLAGQAARVEMEALLQHEQRQVLSGDNPRQLRRFLQVFGDHELADEIRLSLARRELADGQLLNAELMLGKLLADDRSPHAPPAWALMARLMELAREESLAAACYQHLIDRWPDQVCLDGLTGQQIYDQLPTDTPVARRLRGDSSWPYGEVHVEPMKVSPANVFGQTSRLSNLRPIPLLESTGPLPNPLRVAFDSAGTNAIVVRDSLGRERTRITGARGRINRFQDDTLTCKTVGHLLLINLGHGLLAVDVLQPGLTQDKRIRWPDNYSEILSIVANRRDLKVRAQAKTNPWGQRQIRITGRRVQALGPATSEEVVYLQGSRLICVDPATGQTLWIRKDVASDSSVWGDDQLVLTSSQNESTARVFRLLDGEELGLRNLRAPDRRWTTVGRNVLSWSDETRDGQPTWLLRLQDPWTQEDLWQRPFAADSRGYVTVDRELAIVEPNGRFTLLDLVSGRPRLQQTLEPDSRPLRSVYLLPSRSQDLLVCGYRPRADKGTTISSFPSAQSAPLIDAAVYAFDRRSGRPQWQVPAMIQGYSVPLTQPPDLPVLTFVRQVSRAGGGTRARPKLSLLCLDKRDGRILLDVDDLKFSFGSFLMVGNDHDHTVTVRLLNVHNYQLEFTDQPQAPEPPAQTGATASRRGAGLSGIVGAVFDALGKQVQQQRRRGQREVLKLIERGGELGREQPTPPAE